MIFLKINFLILYFLYHEHVSINAILLIACLIFFITFCIITYHFNTKIKKLKNQHNYLLSLIRHDVKGLLSPALLQADRISLNKAADQKIIQSAESIATSIEKTSNYLNSTKDDTL